MVSLTNNLPEQIMVPFLSWFTCQTMTRVKRQNTLPNCDLMTSWRSGMKSVNTRCPKCVFTVGGHRRTTWQPVTIRIKVYECLTSCITERAGCRHLCRAVGKKRLNNIYWKILFLMSELVILWKELINKKQID